MAGSAEASARRDMRIGKTMVAVADAIDSGEAKLLDGVSAKTHIEDLDALVSQAKRKENEKKYSTYSEQEEHKHDPATEETIDSLGDAYYPVISS
jgi:hypothetical protein